MAGTSPAMTKKRILRTRRNLHLPTHLRTLNKMSIKPAAYGERFVKRRGLFCMTVASRCRFYRLRRLAGTMIVRQFISWIRTAPAGERAEATRALARAWLISDLSADDRAAAEGALLMQLDDASPLVRQAMAEVFARSADAPAAIVQALSLDQPSVALPVLEHSPLLIDADLVAKLSETLAQFVVARNWLSADRAGRVASEARDRSTMHIAARSRGEDMRGLVRHLRATSQLTAGLILRALLSGNLELFDTALAELADLPRARVSALLHDRSGASLHALLKRAGLPESTFAAFHVALEAGHEGGFVDNFGDAVRLRRRMVERVLTHCETDRGATEPLMILLRRFATESAREEARMFCDELVADEAIPPIHRE